MLKVIIRAFEEFEGYLPSGRPIGGKVGRLLKQFWIKWRDWSSKTSRKDFWGTLIVFLAISMALSSIETFDFGFNVPLLFIWIIPSTLPMLAIFARRLNDADLSKFFLLFFILPLFGVIILLLLAAVRSKEQRLTAQINKDKNRALKIQGKKELQMLRSEKNEIKIEKRRELQKKKDQKKEIKQQAKKEIEEKKRLIENTRIEKYGKLFFSTSFGFRTIEIFDKGYVSINASLPEKLISISAQISTTKKTGPGRAIGFIASAGLNSFTSNIRGDAFLIISTEKKVHSFRIENPTPENVSSAVSLETASKRFQDQNVEISQTNERTIAADLERLAKLFKQGEISDEEYLLAKRKILG